MLDKPFICFRRTLIFACLAIFPRLKSRAKHGSQGRALRQWQQGTREMTSLIVSLSGPCCHVDFKRACPERSRRVCFCPRGFVAKLSVPSVTRAKPARGGQAGREVCNFAPQSGKDLPKKVASNFTHPISWGRKPFKSSKPSKLHSQVAEIPQ